MNVLFDLDGTLTNSRKGIVGSLRYALSGVSRRSLSDFILEQHIGLPIRETFKSLLGSCDQEEIDAAVALFRDHFSSHGIVENVVYPGIEEALNALQALGTSLYVASSRPHLFVERVLEHCGLKDFFKRAYGCEFDGTRSNKSDLVAHMLKSESILPSASFLVGDRAHDVVAARANGVLAIGVLWGYGSEQELMFAGAVRLCRRPTELRGTLF